MKHFLTFLFIAFLFPPLLYSDEGMWIPLFLAEMNEAEMQAMGMNISAEDIFSLNNTSLKDAIVIFGGGCTGGIISDKGLILTNHHCGYGRIQALSSLENDYLTNGYWAMEQSEELPAPGLKATFLVRIEEVTDSVLNGVTQTMTETERRKKILENINSIQDRATEGNHYQAIIKPFFYGNRFFLTVNEVFEDVRFVGAPPSSIGNFGGDTDNWMWPRHTADFSLFRIYADRDNKPAPYSDENVPYVPKKHLSIALDGVQEGDFTFVFGYPGSTQQYIPSWAVEMQANVLNPVRISIRDKRLDIFRKYMNQSHEIRLQYAAKEASIANGWKKWIGENRGIRRLNAIEQKEAFQTSFSNWVDSDPQRKEKYSSLLPALEKTYSKLSVVSYYAEYLREVLFGIEAFRFSRTFKNLAELSKEKGNEDTIASVIERQKVVAAGFFKDYQPDIDREVFETIVGDYFQRVKKEELPEGLIGLEKKFKGDFAKMKQYLFDNSIFVSQSKVEALLAGYKPAQLKKIEKDPVYQLTNDFFDLYTGRYQEEIRELTIETDSLMRIYMQANIEMQPMRRFYPDANFTLRIAYGNVDGYNPDDGVLFRYYTTLDGIMEKEDPDIFDYKVDKRLKEFHSSGDFGRYADEDGKMRICFIATNHTSGGNSGSPVLNGDGHLIGINFDRCWEGTMSDIIYDMSQCRNISLDIRYCLFIIDKFAGAGHIIDELTIQSNSLSGSYDSDIP
jgi:hypothetical protein